MNLTEHTDFASEYRGMTDEQLLEIAGEGELVDEAQQALQIEMKNRKLTPEMVQSYHAETQRYLLAQKAEVKSELFNFSLFRLYGRTYISEEDKAQGIQVRTKWLTLRGLPIVPVASYRYSCQNVTTGQIKWNEEKVIDQVPLNWNQAIRTWLKSTGLFVLLISLTIICLVWQDRSHR
jgi:murein L,D-transpeptidase YcbB/YkuD